MDTSNETLEVLKEIRDTLNRIFLCFEDEYMEIQQRKQEERVKVFQSLLTENRGKIFPLLFDERHLSQAEIAQFAGVNQSAVSRFISSLIENKLIEQVAESDKIIYHDRYSLLQLTKK